MPKSLKDSDAAIRQEQCILIDRIVVLNDLSQGLGGASSLALASAAAFRRRGLATTVLVGDSGENPALTQAGVEIIALGRARLTASSPSRALVDGLYNRAAAAMVRRWIAANDTQRTAYHLHGWAQILSPSIFAALAPVRDRLVLSAHDFFLVCPNGAYAFLKSGDVCPLVPMRAACILASCDRRNYAHKLWRVARQAVQRRFYDRPRSPPVLAIHERMRPLLIRGGIPNDAIVTLPNPVLPFSLERLPAERNHEALFVGRIEATKGPDLALAAARSAGVTLRLIGDGPLRPALEQQYPEMIFMGRQPPPAIGKLAAGARMLLMPSRYPEPFGLVAVEALWSGLPVIAADTAFLSADIVAAGAGLACAPRDTAAFAAAIRSLQHDDERVAAMSRNARERLPTIGLSEEAWIDRLLRIYAARLGPPDELCSQVQKDVAIDVLPRHEERAGTSSASQP